MLNKSDKNIIPLFLFIYRPLNIVAAILFLLVLVSFYLWFNTQETKSLLLKPQNQAIQFDQKSFKKIKEILNKKISPDLLFEEQTEIKDPF